MTAAVRQALRDEDEAKAVFLATIEDYPELKRVVAGAGESGQEFTDTVLDQAAQPMAQMMADRITQARWQKSEEREQMVKSLRITLASLLLAGMLVGPLFVLAFVDSYDPALPAFLALGAGLGTLVMGCIYAAFVRPAVTLRATQSFEARVQLESLEASEASIEPRSFEEIWRVNQERLSRYHEIATRQSNVSFGIAQLAAGFGLLVIVACAGFAAVAETPAAATVAGLLGAAGGGLAGYIGSTFMRSQATAAAQSRAYFIQPLALSRYLLAERLLEQIEDGKDRGRVASTLIHDIAGTTSTLVKDTEDHASAG